MGLVNASRGLGEVGMQLEAENQDMLRADLGGNLAQHPAWAVVAHKDQVVEDNRVV